MHNKGPVVFVLLVSAVFVCGVVSFWWYPETAHRTYLSENALMPANARILFGPQQAAHAQQLSALFNTAHTLKDLIPLLEQQGAHAHPHPSTAPTSLSCIIKATKGSGTEAIVISTRWRHYPSMKVVPMR